MDTLLSGTTNQNFTMTITDEPAVYRTGEALSKVASAALRQAVTLLHDYGEELISNPRLVEHTSLGSYLSLSAAIAAVYRPELLTDHKYLQTRVRAFRALRYGLFHQFWSEFYEGKKGELPVTYWYRLNDLREAHKAQTLRTAGKWVPVFLYSDLHQYANLLEDYADVFAELEVNLT